MSRILRGSFATIAAAALVLSACGGDDDDAASGATDGSSSAPAATDAVADDSGSGGGDMPQECVDLLGDYLEQIEPLVKDVDWKSADVGQLDQVQTEMGSDFDSLDSEITTKCSDFIFTTSASNLQRAIEIAQDRAPGTVAWLEFVSNLSSSPPATATSDASGDLPTDCDGAQAYIENLMKQYATIMEMPSPELTQLSKVLSIATAQCPPGGKFFSREDVTKFLGG